MPRSRPLALLLAISVTHLVAPAGSGLARADTRSDAEHFNDQGKALFLRGDFEGAAASFREALELVQDPRYDFNLCAALEKSGDWDAALEACDEVFKDGGDAELRAKAGTRSASIRDARRHGPRPPPSQPVVLPQPPPGSAAPARPPLAKAPAPIVMPQNPEDGRGQSRWAIGLDIGPTLFSHTIADPRLGRDRDLDLSPRIGIHVDLALTRRSGLLLRLEATSYDGRDAQLNATVAQNRSLAVGHYGAGLVGRLRLAGPWWLHADAALAVARASYSVSNIDLGTALLDGTSKETWLALPASVGVEVALGDHFALGLALANDLLVPLQRSDILHGSVGDTLALILTLEVRFTRSTRSALPQVELQ
jgi:tetratricopeptide (TPR) repeat protein